LKTKDLVYDKELNEISSIPSLHYQSVTHHFTLRNIDPKLVSTLKALNPKAFSRIKEARKLELLESTVLLDQICEDRDDVPTRDVTPRVSGDGDTKLI
jgi:hypothetical protein